MSASTIAVFLLLYLAAQQCDSMLYWHSKSIRVPMTHQYDQSLVFDRRTFTNPRVLFALCNSGDRHRKCEVHRFRRILGKDQHSQYNCQVSIEAEKNNSAISDKIRLLPLGKDRAIIAYLERTNHQTFLGLISVRLADCSTHKTPDLYQIDQDINSRPYEFELLAVATKETTYDAIFLDSKLCGDQYCKISVDVERNIVHGPEKWITTNRHQQVVDLVPFGSSKEHKFLILEFGGGRTQFSFLNENNDRKYLKSYGPKTKKTSWTLAYSTANERSGICNLIDATLNCIQYDNFGWPVPESNSEHRFDEDDDIWITAMHNLQAGNGILVLLIEHVPNRYKIIKLDPRGKMVGRLEVTRFDCDWRENAIAGQFFELNDQYCASLACYDSGEFSASKKDKGHVDVLTQCFLLSDLETIY